MTSSSSFCLSLCILLSICYQEVRGQRGHSHLCDESSCYPATGDLLIGREHRLKTTSTCGMTKPDRYCIVSHLEDQINKCFVCDSRRPYSDQNRMSHRIENIVSTFRRDWKHHWWQAENGVQGVSIQLDLEAEFHFTHLIMRFKTFRPAAMLIERSYDFGKTWKVYRYFAYDCADSWPNVPTAAQMPVRRIQDVFCESRYSDVAPSTEGEIIFRVLPPGTDRDEIDPYSEEVQDLLKMTNLRVNFTKLHTLGDNLLDNRPEIKEKYYYSMYHMVVRGSCSCYGHASHCVPTPEQVGNPDMVYGQCNCTHNTMGLNCERCAEFYNDLPWAPARQGQTNACKECQCNGHASRCHFDPAVYEATGRVSGGVCDDCQHNTMGHHCEECKPFFYQDPSRDITDPNVCRPCDCDPIGSEHGGECESRTDYLHELVAGRCVCKRFVEGQRCDTCINNYWNMRADNYDGCEPCGCNLLGTIGNEGCDKETGQCRCKRYVQGQQCDQCMPGYYGLSEDLPGCKPCDCDVGGAVDNECDQETGQCKCRANIVGRRCDETQPGYFVMSLDWEKYEAEFARCVGNCQVVVREVTPGRPATWTGPGFMRVMEGSALEFIIDDIPMSGEYDIVVRYEGQMPQRWDDVRLILIRPGPVDQRGACANSIPQDDFKSFGLSAGDHSYTVSPSTCLEKGVRYTLQLKFQRYRSDRFTPEAGILVDSIVLMPALPSHPIKEGHSPDIATIVLDEIERYRCREMFLNARTTDLPEYCSKHVFSISVHTYDGAEDCDCHPEGSYEAICNPIGGQCRCKPNVIGRKCDRCATGAFAFGPAGCTACECSGVGSVDNSCDQTTGQCSCVPNAYGRQCDQCQRGFYGFPNCRPCQCNGRSDDCDDQGRCTSCRDYTGGSHCERCADGFYGDPRPGSPYPCRPCMCPGGEGSDYQHADTCRLDTRNNQVICDCRTGYAGANCEHCADNYFGNPLVPGGVCERCVCNHNIDYNVPGSCDASTGECLKCQYFTEGFNCERCRPGYFGDATRQSCQPCLCNILGTHRSAGHCDQVNGQCHCLPHVVGKKCDQCERNYWKLASGQGCEACDCDPVGSRGEQCNEFDGQCECREDRGGRDCSECVDNYWGDPRYSCEPCNCNPQGSTSQQCDRRTGRCECAPGVTGDKCDRCARGTTGELPYCVPCGECFDNWDHIIEELRNETSVLVSIGSEIKYGGAPGAFDREFQIMEDRLEEVRRILAGSNISVEGLEDMQAKLQQLRSNLTSSEQSLDQLDTSLEDTTSRIETVNNRIESIKHRVENLKVLAEHLKANATAVKEMDVSGAYNSIRDSHQRSRDAQDTVDSTTHTVRRSTSVRHQVEALLNGRSSNFDPNYDSNENTMTNITIQMESFNAKIRGLNSMVCGGSGYPCDSKCGGAGCGKCGPSTSGIGCGDSAVAVAENALGIMNKTEHVIRVKKEETEVLLTRVTDSKDLCEMANRDAQMAYDRALFAKNQSESSRTELQQLIEQIAEFLELQGAKPEDIQQLAEEVLAMSISLTPAQIEDLARQIEDTIRGLTNIDAILDATRADLERVRNLKERADRAKADADDVLDTANRVVDALEKAGTAQDAAEKAITDTDQHISDIENDLDSIENQVTTAEEKSSTSVTRVHDLRDRIQALKRKFAANKVKVDQAAEAADSASILANKAEKDSEELTTKYSVVSHQLEVKYNETVTARNRADYLKSNATALYSSTRTKVERLREMDRKFTDRMQELQDLSVDFSQLHERMTSLLIDIRDLTQFHLSCSG